MTDAKERVIKVISKILDLNKDEIENLKKETGYKRLKKWTSARHAEIIVGLEDEFGVEIKERAIPKLKDVRTILSHLSGAAT